MLNRRILLKSRASQKMLALLLTLAMILGSFGIGPLMAGAATAMSLPSGTASITLSTPGLYDISTADSGATVTVAANGIGLTGTNGNLAVVIDAGYTVTLVNANITSSFSSVITAGGTGCGIILSESNSVKTTSNQAAGVYVPSTASLTIDGPGSLTAIANGANWGAGIGSVVNEGSGQITIENATVTATGKGGGAGIGGGHNGNGNNITIINSSVTASGNGGGGAGIGGGSSKSGSYITIIDSTVTASAGNSNNAAGIGGGDGGGSGSYVTITSSAIKAIGGYTGFGGMGGGAGIGGGGGVTGGTGGSSSNISIDASSSVYAVGGNGTNADTLGYGSGGGGAAIGGGGGGGSNGQNGGGASAGSASGITINSALASGSSGGSGTSSYGGGGVGGSGALCGTGGAGGNGSTAGATSGASGTDVTGGTASVGSATVNLSGRPDPSYAGGNVTLADGSTYVSQPYSVPSVTNPSNVIVPVGGSASFTVTASGGTAPLFYQWQLSTDSGTTWTDISGATETTLSLSNVAFADNGNRYRCLVDDSVWLEAVSGAATLTVTATYDVSLNQTGTYSFTGAAYGYTAADIATLTLTVTNTGNMPTGALHVALSGTSAASFTIINDNISGNSLAVSGADTFDITPNTGLNAGTYTAAVTVTGNNGISASFNVSFAVSQAQQAALTLIGYNNAYTYGDGPFGLSVSGGSGAGAVTYTATGSAVSIQNGVDQNGNSAADQAKVTINQAGAFTITAAKAADANYSQASVTSGEITVSQANPGLNATTAATGSAYGNDITVNAAVYAVGDGITPVGMVTLSEGGALLDSQTLSSSGTAVLTAARPSGGLHDYTIAYSGQSGYYNPVSLIIQSGVGLADQAPLSITGLPASVTYGAGGFTLSANGGSGTGAVSFSAPNNNGVVNITTGGAVTIIGAGTTTITAVKGADSNYNSVSAQLVITVLPRDIANATVTVAGEPFTYTGSQLQPNFSVSDGSIAITTGDYTNAYGANINAGTGGGSVTLTGQGNYTGTKTINFDITPADLAAADLTVADQQIYNGSQLTPAVTVMFNGVNLQAADYTITYDANVNAGTGGGNLTITALPGGNFTGAQTVSFDIAPLDLSTGTVTLTGAAYPYTGSPIEPTVVSVLVNGIVVPAMDYDVSYADNTNPGTATVTVTANAAGTNFTGSAETNFVINEVAAPVPAAPVLTAGPVNRTSDKAAAVQFTSDTAGTYYYAVAASGAAQPVIDTSGAGAHCGTAANTISLTNLTAGAQVVYIVVRDSQDQLSNVLAINIPAYSSPGNNTGGGGGSSASPSNSLSTSSVSFTKDSSADVTVTLNSGGYTLTGLTNGGSTLQKGTDYTVSGNTITISAAYLNTLPAGVHNITMAMSGGANPVLKITIADNSNLAPANPTTPAAPTAPAAPQPGNQTGQTANPFVDVHSGDWFYNDVLYVYGNGLMTGTSTSPMRFSPQTNLTRAMLVTILYRAAGSPDTSTLTNQFSDVAAGQWYTQAVKWAAANGIVTGYTSSRFGPHDSITREQLAAIIYRYAQFTGQGTPSAGTAQPSFGDSKAIADWAVAGTTFCYQHQVIGGYPDGSFRPQGTASRAEVAAMLHRYLTAAQ